MRYIRRQTTNTQSSGIGRGVHVTPIDKEVILDSVNSVRVPKGPTESRPKFPKNGHLRYYTDDNRLGNGDATAVVFGPLNSGDTYYPVPAAAQNVLVFAENVFQIPITNYTLAQNPAGKAAGWYIEFASPVDAGKPVTVLHNFDK